MLFSLARNSLGAVARVSWFTYCKFQLLLQILSICLSLTCRSRSQLSADMKYVISNVATRSWDFCAGRAVTWPTQHPRLLLWRYFCERRVPVPQTREASWDASLALTPTASSSESGFNCIHALIASLVSLFHHFNMLTGTRYFHNPNEVKVILIGQESVTAAVTVASNHLQQIGYKGNAIARHYNKSKHWWL